MVMVVGMIFPPLISQDIRSRAFLLYFSRPLVRTEYVLGKLASLWTFLALISSVPALSLYLIGLLLSPSLEVAFDTWDIPLRILGASVALMLPTSSLALCLSSLTQESRYAGFAWFAIWVMGWFAFGAATSAEAMNAQMPTQGTMGMQGSPGSLVIEDSPWTHLSLYHTLGRVQRWIFGFIETNDVLVSLAILIVLTVGSLRILYWRISAPMRA
jgi:ABC-type transport system involved in multi-copper enzyme maturation permease subunit